MIAERPAQAVKPGRRRTRTVGAGLRGLLVSRQPAVTTLECLLQQHGPIRPHRPTRERVEDREVVAICERGKDRGEEVAGENYLKTVTPAFCRVKGRPEVQPKPRPRAWECAWRRI